MVSLYFERLYPQENPKKEIEEKINKIYVEIKEFYQTNSPEFKGLQKKQKNYLGNTIVDNE